MKDLKDCGSEEVELKVECVLNSFYSLASCYLIVIKFSITEIELIMTCSNCHYSCKLTIMKTQKLFYFKIWRGDNKEDVLSNAIIEENTKVAITLFSKKMFNILVLNWRVHINFYFYSL